MKLFSETLTHRDLDNIADAMGIQIYNYRDTPVRTRGKYKGKRGHEFVLRPSSFFHDDYGRWQRGGNGLPGNMNKNKIWAISWAGHYVFMRVVFNMDPDAVIVSARNQFQGFHDFDATAYATGFENIGSMVQPQQYRDSEFREHVEWNNEEDLIRLSKDVMTQVKVAA